MTVKLKEFVTYTGNERGGIGANSTDTTAGDVFVNLVDGVVSPAVAGGNIDGVSLTRAVYAADNQTVAKKALNFIPKEAHVAYEVTVVDATISQANEGNYFDLKTAGTVGGTTASDTTGQLRLVKALTTTVGVFEIANK